MGSHVLPKFEMTPRAKRWVFLIAAIVTLPLFLLTLLLAFSVVNPMGMAFLTSFEVVNETNETLSVTPIGAVGARGVRHTLPHSISSKFYVMGTKTGEFEIQPNSSRRFTYDWDDIQFSEILIHRPSGDLHFISTGLDPIERQYRRPEQDRFVISDIDALPRAEAHLISALPDSPGRGWMLYGLAGFGLLSPVFFRLARKAKTKAERHS